MGTFNEPNCDKKVFNSSQVSTYGACGFKIFVDCVGVMLTIMLANSFNFHVSSYFNCVFLTKKGPNKAFTNVFLNMHHIQCVSNVQVLHNIPLPFKLTKNAHIRFYNLPTHKPSTPTWHTLKDCHVYGHTCLQPISKLHDLGLRFLPKCIFAMSKKKTLPALHT